MTTIVDNSSSQMTNIAILDIKFLMIDALHDLSLKYYVNNNNSKLDDYSIQV
jgi:hypothetical protein